MNINISYDLYLEISDYITKRKSIFGYKKYNVTVDQLCEKKLKQFINKQKHLDNANVSSRVNNGKDWLQFKRKHMSEIIIRDQRTCQYCGKYLHLNDMTLDHKTPPARGGQNTLENLVLSCWWCNSDKGILDNNEYRYKQMANKAKGIGPY
jgi:hypothetical protein